MLTENAVVLSYCNGIAKVQCESQSACGSCAAKQGCGTSVLSELAGEKGKHILTVESLIPLKAGQIVQIGLAEKSLIFTALLMYMVPLISILLTTFITENLFVNELTRATLIFLTTALSFLLVRRYSKQLNQQRAYQPVLLRVIG
ncbi:SoxR reducing system RseC family protein [Volucribacter amazonae]|uniref:RseC/MucC-like positive regulator of sigma(E) n=1 Tax=Volucribacter amazonae TaxID=256731 RepID=A0A9X4SKT3_9PAST|nr:SoxR reducing system RseC family protein [Volucribacter amazonae]MDG6895439.1 hypothetical protein [Volucribacter amazonae]